MRFEGLSVDGGCGGEGSVKNEVSTLVYLNYAQAGGHPVLSPNK